MADAFDTKVHSDNLHAQFAGDKANEKYPSQVVGAKADEKKLVAEDKHDKKVEDNKVVDTHKAHMAQLSTQDLVDELCNRKGVRFDSQKRRFELHDDHVDNRSVDNRSGRLDEKK